MSRAAASSAVSTWDAVSFLVLPWIPPKPGPLLTDRFRQTKVYGQPAANKQTYKPFSQVSLVLKVYAKLNIRIDSGEKKKKRQQHTRCLAHICFKIVTPASAFISRRFEDWCFQRVHMLATTCECLKKLFCTKPGK